MISDEELIGNINEIKQKRKAIILAHNYQLAEVQDVADFVGDSLELAKKATTVEAEVILFCGVHFMAETAKILNPAKTVLIPDINAGCPMADMISGDQLREQKKKLKPGTAIVCYVNSTAEVKAESDVCCTSANSVKIVNEVVKENNIYFVPDQYLAQYTARFTDKTITYWPGYCPTHARLTSEDIIDKRAIYPKAEVLVHPECPPNVIDSADYVFSTGGIIKHVRQSRCRQFIIGSEMGLISRLRKENPNKQFVLLSELAVCPYMKLIRLETVLRSLQEMTYIINLDAALIRQAKKTVERMITA